jgi:hypothetical protein
MEYKKDKNYNDYFILIHLLKTNDKKCKYRIIKFFMTINKAEKLKQIYNYDDITIEIIKEKFLLESK